ncbi:MAG: isochorismatase family protein [Psychromonas sp.]|nr:isochorismatase family protein [Psychromonas sp.]
MIIHSSLLEQMQMVASSLAVLVIDEEEEDEDLIDRDRCPDDDNRFNLYPIKDITGGQQKVIMLAQALNCPVFLIQFDRGFPAGSYIYNHKHDLSSYKRAIKKSLRALLPKNTRVINKRTYNAFSGKTDLANILRKEHSVKNLVVMGWHSNLCIPATIGPEIRLLGEDFGYGPGAVDNNFTVMTSQRILNGSSFNWYNHSPLIELYTLL